MTQGLSPMGTDVLPHKRQVVVDRLRRRMESYRRRQTDCQPRFDQTFGGLCEQNMQDTLALKQRFLETKAKRQNKTKQDKQNKLVQQVVHQQNDSANAALQSSVHVQQKFLKRGNEELENTGNDGLEPPVKLQCTAQHNQAHTTHPGSEGLTKFSVEIVQQLEFTTSAANSQPQQISTNVTVKALTNTSVKSDISSPKSNPSTPASNSVRPNSNIGCVDIGTLVECKQEPDNDFADLDQCAAALEKDAQANGGNSFPGFPEFIGDDTSDEIITSDTFKDLISEISDLNPEFMKDFDFDEKCDVNSSNLNSLPPNGLKVEDTKDINLVNQANNGLLDIVKSSHSPLLQNAYSPPIYESQGLNKNRLPYPTQMDFPKTELSPAAQTLKQMAEQHQHKNQMGLAFNNPPTRVPTSRSPYTTDFQFANNEFLGSPNSNPANVGIHQKNFSQADLIKQELNIFNNQPKGGNIPPGVYNKQYSPYGSPSPNHGSPGYMPGRGGPGGPQGPGGPPPRPSSGTNSTSQAGSTTLQINQAQQLHISQQPGHAIQVSAGQHLHLSSDLKGSVSIAAQQGMYFSQQQSNNANQQHSHQQQQQQSQPPPQQQQQQQQQPQQQQPQQPHPQQQPQNQQQPHSHPQTSTANNQHSHSTSSNSNTSQSSHTSQSQSHNIHNPQNPQNQRQQKNTGNGPGGGVGGPGPGPNTGGMGPGPGPGVGVSSTNTQHTHSTITQTQQMQQQGDTYTVSQSQTINFTQQSLRQRAAAQAAAAAAAANKAPNMASMGGYPNQRGTVQIADPNMMGGGHQHNMHHHMHGGGMHNNMGGIRPPPPDYKSSAALMQGGGPAGYPPQVPQNTSPNIMRRLTQQAMPPSGPMMRPQQQQYNIMGGQMRQGIGGAGAGGVPYNNIGNQMRMAAGGADTNWQNMMMSQQNAGYGGNQMRGMMNNPGNMSQMMNPMQGMGGGGLPQLTMSQGNGMPQPTQMMGGFNQGQPMGGGMHMNHMGGNHMMNPAMMGAGQPQNIHRQSSAQMSITNINMSQQQSFSMNNTTIHQSNNNSQLNNTSNTSNSLVSASNNTNNNNNQQSANNSLANFSHPTPDFSLDFLENLPAGDTNNFSAQDLLNSLDNDPGFNLQDIL